jgi:hypothetical protein
MMPSGISPRRFFDKFEMVVAQEAQSKLICEAWSIWTDYTQLMRQTVFAKVARELDLLYYPRDYYTLDGIMYTELDIENFPPGKTYAKSLSVALEHENDPSGSMAEMNKLQLFNVPLKVLVTYPDRRYPAEALLTKYADATRQADIFDDFSTLRRQLVIFGSKPAANAEWRGFVYSKGTFVPVAEFEVEPLSRKASA